MLSFPAQTQNSAAYKRGVLDTLKHQFCDVTDFGVWHYSEDNAHDYQSGCDEGLRLVDDFRDYLIAKHGRKSIADELLHTAQGRGYCGGALHAAKDIDWLSGSDRACIMRWLSSAHTSSDCIKLQDIAAKIVAGNSWSSEMQASRPMPSRAYRISVEEPDEKRNPRLNAVGMILLIFLALWCCMQAYAARPFHAWGTILTAIIETSLFQPRNHMH